MAKPGMLMRTGPGKRRPELQQADDEAIRIIDNLFMGSFEAAKNKANLQKNKVTHILSLLSSGGLEYTEDEFTVECVHINDMEGADLLSRLPLCVDFIGASLAGGGACFVHCMSGVSRSAAAIIAFLLSKGDFAEVDEALEFCKKQRPSVDPNDGFLRQLRLFKEMGFQLEGTSPAHAQYRLQRLNLAKNAGRTDENARFAPSLLAADPKEAQRRRRGKGESGGAASAAASAPRPAFLCRSCRRPLFLLDNILAHQKEEGGGEETKGKRRQAAEKKQRPSLEAAALEEEEEEDEADEEQMKSLSRKSQSVADHLLTPSDEKKKKKKSEHPPVNEEEEEEEGQALSRKSKSRGSFSKTADFDQVKEKSKKKKKKEMSAADGGALQWSVSHLKSPRTPSTFCSSIFIEPMAWMQEITADRSEGKLNCPDCSARLGVWNWEGSPCSCGGFVKPAFRLLLSKVEPNGDMMEEERKKKSTKKSSSKTESNGNNGLEKNDSKKKKKKKK